MHCETVTPFPRPSSSSLYMCFVLIKAKKPTDAVLCICLEYHYIREKRSFNSNRYFSFSTLHDLWYKGIVRTDVCNALHYTERFLNWSKLICPSGRLVFYSIQFTGCNFWNSFWVQGRAQLKIADRTSFVTTSPRTPYFEKLSCE